MNSCVTLRSKSYSMHISDAELHPFFFFFLLLIILEAIKQFEVTKITKKGRCMPESLSLQAALNKPRIDGPLMKITEHFFRPVTL